MNKIYINSIKQISAQHPLVEDWFEYPVYNSEPYVRAVEPDFKQFFTPTEARRLGKILKRALLVSRLAMQESGISSPDAIITGTGLGCIESTEIFLDKLVRDGEEFLNPTHFMQSTHNTIGSLIAIDVKCNSYNNTFSHKGISFECALQDAFLQMKQVDKLRNVKNVLVGAHDEMTPAYFTLLKKAGYVGNPNQIFACETSVAMMLSTEKTEKNWCEIEEIEKIYCDMRCATSAMRQISNRISHISNPDYIMIGTNGNSKNDNIYFENCAKLFPNIPLLHYKPIFGESYTAPALGVYAAATCLKLGKVPSHLRCEISVGKHEPNNVNKILCYNHFENKNHTFILLSR